MKSVPRSKRLTSHLIFPRDRPLADLRVAVSIRNWLFCLISIFLSRFFLSGSFSKPPGNPPGGWAALPLALAGSVLLEGDLLLGALEGWGKWTDWVADGCVCKGCAQKLDAATWGAACKVCEAATKAASAGSEAAIESTVDADGAEVATTEGEALEGVWWWERRRVSRRGRTGTHRRTHSGQHKQLEARQEHGKKMRDRKVRRICCRASCSWSAASRNAVKALFAAELRQ